MKTKKEYEKDILDYFNKFKRVDMESHFKHIKTGDYSSDLVKTCYVYHDYKSPITFDADIVDFAVWSISENRFVYIEYPWRLDDGELIYEKLYL